MRMSPQRYLVSDKFGKRRVRVLQTVQLADDGVREVDLEGGLEDAILLFLTLPCQGCLEEMAGCTHLGHRDDARM